MPEPEEYLHPEVVDNSAAEAELAADTTAEKVLHAAAVAHDTADAPAYHKLQAAAVQESVTGWAVAAAARMAVRSYY